MDDGKIHSERVSNAKAFLYHFNVGSKTFKIFSLTFIKTLPIRKLVCHKNKFDLAVPSGNGWDFLRVLTISSQIIMLRTILISSSFF